MLSILEINFIVVIVLTIVISICSVGIVVAIQFQNKQKRKYQECLKLIKEKENGSLGIKDGIDIDEIKKISKNIDANKLMQQLYDIFLEFITKINNNDKNFEYILDGFIKELYENKIDVYIAKNYFEILDSIELIDYSILEYDRNVLKFRININCFDYKKRNGEIISGSNLQKVEQIYILTYTKPSKKWLINCIEKVFEKKLSI